MDTITTQAPPAADPAPIEGTVALRQPGTTAATGAQRKQDGALYGPLLWELVNRYLGYYVSFRTQEELVRVAAWVFHASARKRGESGMGPPIWNALALLLIKSRKRGAGKSTLLRLIAFLTGSGKTPRITAARFAQLTGQAYETVCVDEARSVLGAGGKQMDLQGCILDSYQPGSFYQVSRTKLSLFGFVAIATKESLITDATKAVDGDESSIGDILDRCLSVTLTAPAMPPPEVGKRAEAEGAVLCRALIAWTDTNRDALEQAAEDIADEDHKAAIERARRGEKATETPRALQIGRPLRAVGRVIDQQAITAARRANAANPDPEYKDPEPQYEAEILACLGSQAEDIMAELEGLSEGWGDGPHFTEDEPEDICPEGNPPGRIVYADDPGDEPPPQPAPAGQYQAGYAMTRPGHEPAVVQFPGTWPTLEEAQRACEDEAGEELAWEPSPRQPGTWGATVSHRYSGIERAYAVSQTGE